MKFWRLSKFKTKTVKRISEKEIKRNWRLSNSNVTLYLIKQNLCKLSSTFNWQNIHANLMEYGTWRAMEKAWSWCYWKQEHLNEYGGFKVTFILCFLYSLQFYMFKFTSSCSTACMHQATMQKNTRTLWIWELSNLG